MTDITTIDVNVGEVTFHLSTSGNTANRAVLWLHGSGPGVTAMTNWQQQLDILASDFYNIAPDVVGFGDSTHPDPPPQGMAAFTDLRVKTLIALLDHLGVDQVDIVGNSMGAIIGLCLTLSQPHRVGRIVLMGAAGAPIPLTSGLRSLILFYDNPTVEAMAGLLANFVSDPAIFGDQLAEIAKERMPRATRPDVERSHRATFAQTGRPLPLTEAVVAAITQPVLLIHGENDRIIAPDASRWYAKTLPNARLCLVEQAGHWLQIEHADMFAEMVRDFLRGP